MRQCFSTKPLMRIIHKSLLRRSGVSRRNSLWRISVLGSTTPSPGEIQENGMTKSWQRNSSCCMGNSTNQTIFIACGMKNLSLCRSEYLSCSARSHLRAIQWMEGFVPQINNRLSAELKCSPLKPRHGFHVNIFFTSYSDMYTYSSSMLK